MKIEYKKVVKIDELSHIVRHKYGATFSQLWQVFYYTRLFKYMTYAHYVQIKTAYNKICTEKNMNDLCQLEYIKSPQKGVYCATDKVLPILKEAGFRTEILPSEPVGKGDVNELNNTDIFVKLVKLPTFEMLLYPQFKDTETNKSYIIPDALLVQKHEAKRMYKLTFFEIEANKPNWETYIEKKRSNYIRLSKDIGFYNYWASICPHLGLPEPDINNLGFSVRFIGTIAKDFGYGFTFTNRLNSERS